MTIRSELRRLRRRAGDGRCRSCGQDGPPRPDVEYWVGPAERGSADWAAVAAVYAPVVARARSRRCGLSFCPDCGRGTGKPMVFSHATAAENAALCRLLARHFAARGDAGEAAKFAAFAEQYEAGVDPTAPARPTTDCPPRARNDGPY